MIQKRVGDLLQVEEGGNYFHVVLTKAAMFGGNTLFAFHNDGMRREIGSLTPDRAGFNVCSDLVPPEWDNRVTRRHRFDYPGSFLA